MRRLMASMICALLVGPAVGRAAEFQVTSPTIKDQSTIGNEHVFNGFGCTAEKSLAFQKERLNYARIIPMVDYTARLVGRLLT